MKKGRFGVLTLASIVLLLVSVLGLAVARSRVQAAPRSQTAPADSGVNTARVEAEDNDGASGQDDAQESKSDTADKAGQTDDANEGQAEGADKPGDGEDSSAAAAAAASVSPDAARQAAQSFLKAGQAGEAELENSGGRLIYSVEVGSKEVMVDAKTGAVIGSRADD